jgi:hypothetical protein
MFRFSYAETEDGERWNLCGHLAGPWVDELRSFWRQVHGRDGHAKNGRAPSGKPLVDLREVVSIDESGEKLLADMDCAGAKFLVAGVEHQHLIANLNCGGKRTLRRRMEHLGITSRNGDHR